MHARSVGAQRQLCKQLLLAWHQHDAATDVRPLLLRAVLRTIMNSSCCTCLKHSSAAVLSGAHPSKLAAPCASQLWLAAGRVRAGAL